MKYGQPFSRVTDATIPELPAGIGAKLFLGASSPSLSNVVTVPFSSFLVLYLGFGFLLEEEKSDFFALNESLGLFPTVFVVDEVNLFALFKINILFLRFDDEVNDTRLLRHSIP